MDQRKNQRFQLRLPVELVRLGSQPINLTGETKNVSSSGVLFTCENHVNIGDPIEYMVTFPSSTHGTQVRLRCIGTVMRHETTEGEEAAARAPFAVAATMDRYEFIRSKA